MENDKPMTKLLTVDELADLSKLSPATIYRQWRSLKGLKIGGSIRFDWNLTRDSLLKEAQEGETVVIPISKAGRVSSRGRIPYQEGSPSRRGSRSKIYLPPSKNGLW